MCHFTYQEVQGRFSEVGLLAKGQVLLSLCWALQGYIFFHRKWAILYERAHGHNSTTVGSIFAFLPMLLIGIMIFYC
jgi:hypothetical protein